MKLKTLAKAVGCAGILLAASQGQADVITDWNWTLDAGWTAASDSGNTAFATTDTQRQLIDPVTYDSAYSGAPGWDTLRWGVSTGQGQSQLEITNPNAFGNFTLTDDGGGVFVSGDIPGTNIVHSNNPINSPTLASATLSEFFTLTPTAGGPTLTDAPVFDVGFDETVNTAEAADCEYTGLANNPACTDVFVLQNPGDLIREIPFQGVLYTFEIFEEGLVSPGDNDLDDSICDLVGESGCLTLVTNESAENEFDFGFRVSAQKIPEQVPAPSALALLGLGLFGIGFGRRLNRRG